MLAKPTLGLAGEYAVASELCRRGIDAQITLGHAKMTDILAYSDKARVVRIEVKSKQGTAWPQLKGVSRRDALFILVDFYRKGTNERPDFYILSPEDWKALVYRLCAKEIERGDVEVSKENIPIWVKQIKGGSVYKGMSVGAAKVGDEHRERWDKIEQALQD